MANDRFGALMTVDTPAKAGDPRACGDSSGEQARTHLGTGARAQSPASRPLATAPTTGRLATHSSKATAASAGPWAALIEGQLCRALRLPPEPPWAGRLATALQLLRLLDRHVLHVGDSTSDALDHTGRADNNNKRRQPLHWNARPGRFTPIHPMDHHQRVLLPATAAGATARREVREGRR